MSETTAAPRTLHGRVEFLDCLRGLAATWVVIVHVAHIPGPALHVPKWMELFVNSGPMGVELFFAVSAFSLYLAMPSHSSDRHPLLTFAIRRFFRIAPLFYALLLVMIPWNPSGAKTGIIDIFLNVIFAFNFFPGNQPSIVPIGWTIGVEMPFYVIFPLIYLFANDLKKALLVLLLTIVAYDVEHMLVSSYMQNWEDYQLYSIFRRLPVFACGGVAYFVVRDMPKAWKNSTTAALCMAAAAVIFFAEAQQKEAFLDVYTWRGVMFALVIVGLGCFQFRIVVNRFLQFIGKISYSLYLLHIPVILFLIPSYRWIEARAVPSVSFCLCVAITWVAAVLLAWFVNTVYEAPMNSFGRSLAKRVGRASSLADNSAAA